MDRIDRRGFLECMAWTGTALVWTATGGVLSSRALAEAADESPAGRSKTRCETSIHAPIPMTSTPVPSERYASMRWGISHADPIEASSATRTMPLVWESVTKMPSTSASTGRPRTPTM